MGIYLECAFCGTSFLRDKFRGEMADKGEKVYCSDICSQGKTPPSSLYFKRRGERQQGPCPTCGKMFYSVRAKKFCTLDCYLKNPETLERLRVRNTTRTVFKDGGVKIKKTCPNCSKEWEEKPSRNSKFCSSRCYRLFMAKRFDRWIANPQKISLPQNYDEFLVQDELPCLVEGCTWKGQHLSNHMNFWHGIRAEDVKRAAGFNLTTGLVALPTHDVLAARPHIHEYRGSFEGIDRKDLAKYKTGYSSRERSEHLKKSLSLISKENKLLSVAICEGCGKEFEIRGNSHAQRFCSVPCRGYFYYKNKYLNGVRDAKCCQCGKDFKPTYSQVLRIRKGLEVVCSDSCKGKMNGSKPKPNFKGKYSKNPRVI